MTLVRIDFRDEERRIAILGSGTVRSSTDFGWQSLYFEHREGGQFETTDHVIDGHYLMVKLNPLSKAERKLDGKIKLEVQRRGATAYIPDGCPHRVRYATALGGLHIVVVPKVIVEEVASELGIARFSGVPNFANSEDRFVLEMAKSIDRELANGNPHGEIYAQIQARAIAAHIVTQYSCIRAKEGNIATLSSSMLRWIDQYVDSKLSYPISLSELAELAGLSEYYFCRVFKKTAGMSPYQYVLQKRMEFACARLREDGSSIQDIAFASGFGDPVQFTKQFKRVNGVTPSWYRAEYLARKRIFNAG